MLKPDRSRNRVGPHESFFQKDVRAAFSTRRNKLENCLKPFLGENPAAVARGVTAGIDLDRRAETPGLDELYSLADFLR